MRDRGKMHHGFDALDERAPVELGGDVRDEDLVYARRSRARRNRPPSCNADRVSPREQFAAERGADEPGSTRDENAHVRTAGSGAAFPY